MERERTREKIHNEEIERYNTYERGRERIIKKLKVNGKKERINEDKRIEME